jgi:cytochrome c
VQLSHLILALLSVQSVHKVRQDPPPDDRFEKRVLARGFARPMELEVAPDGLVFLIEVEGRVSVYDPVSAEVRTVLELAVFAEQENGLLGLALDPEFERTRHIFLLYSPPDFVGQRLARFDWTGEQLDPTSEVVCFEFAEQRRECCHHAGSLEFGPDGCLFIATGDNTHPHGDSHGYAPIDERADRFPWDAQRSSANSDVYGGKVLRVRPLPDGRIEIPEGNLFPDGEGGRPEIYAMGCRNPWRIGVDQQTGYLYWGEVGPDAYGDGERGPRGYDEINQARAAGNFGWPLFIANNLPYAWVDFDTNAVGHRFDPAKPVNRSLNNSGARVLPPAMPAWIYYPYGDSDVFPLLNAPGGRTACAGPVYDFDASLASATKLPAWFDRGLFVFEWSRHWIKIIHLDEDSNIASISPLPGGFNFKRPVDIDIAPDGTLYVLEYGETWNANEDSALVRIDYHPGNRPPIARASVEPKLGAAPLRVHLSAAETIDPDGDALTYRWSGAGGVLLGEGAELDIEIVYEGEHVLALDTTDVHGASSRTSVGVLVGNTPPEVRLAVPRDGGFYDAGEAFSWEMQVRDLEDGEPGDGDPQWWVEGASLKARFIAGAPPKTDTHDEHPAVLRMRASDCFNCHAIERRVVGPAFSEIAERYRADDEALERVVLRVRDGSADIWGSQPMLAHPDLTPEALREMVSWVLSLEPDNALRVEQGFRGRIETSAAEASGCWLLEASFQDGGGTLEMVPSLTSRDRVVVRSRRIEAEHFSDRRGTKSLASESASGGHFIGDIQHSNYLRFDDVDLAGIAELRISVSSNGAGGLIVLRRGAIDGPSLASVRVENNAAWEDWHTLTQTIDALPGKADLFLVFSKDDKEGALMNVDWFEFWPSAAPNQK